MKPIDRRSFLALLFASGAAARPLLARVAEQSSGTGPLDVTYYYLPG
jgi:hypothetical protein